MTGKAYTRIAFAARAAMVAAAISGDAHDVLDRAWMALAALAGLTSVAFGAFAAHGVTDPKPQEWLRTGALYGFMHAIAVFASALFLQLGATRARFSPAFFLAGVALFSGSLYAMAFGGPRWLGAVTPIGGLAFMIGWAVLIWAAMQLDRTP